MKGDFTRDTFDASKYFTRVLMQQGRVQLDADWNEQVAVLLHYLQALAADLIGPYGGPYANAGFKISEDSALPSDFFVEPGRYYVDGILCELNPEIRSVSSTGGNSPALTLPNPSLDGRQLAANDWVEIQDNLSVWNKAQISSIDYENSTLRVKGTLPQNPTQIRRVLTYRQQRDYPGAQMDADGTTSLAYLDVWERHITQLDDDHIREVALGGPDTTTRARVVWQVKLRPASQCLEISNLERLSSVRMRARLRPEDPSSDPCIIPPDSKYRGAENQLYRVEIHRDGTASNTEPWTFKWSRENGSVEAIWLGETEEGALIVNSTRGFAASQWVEITRESDELRNEPGTMFKIKKVEGNAISLESYPDLDKDVSLKIRRWDQKEVGDVELIDGAVKGVAGQWLDLENGIQVYFETGGKYRSGDYWLIPARVATGQIEWPSEQDAEGKARKDSSGFKIPKALPPRGIVHHYAPLAMLTRTGNAVSISEDCRCEFSLTKDCPPSTGG